MSKQKLELKCILMYIKKIKKNKLVDKDESLKNLYDEGKLLFKMTTNQIKNIPNLKTTESKKHIVKLFKTKVNNVIFCAIKTKKMSI